MADEARIAQARKVLSTHRHRNMPWPAVISTAKNSFSYNEIIKWAEEMLQGRWACYGFVFFIEDEYDLTLFTLKWS